MEIGPGILVRRYAALDQTLGLVIGGDGCLVVDTGRDEVHGAELAAAVRTVTALPWTAMITHAHWDHFFGTASFLPCSVLAHERCRDVIAERAGEMRERGLVCRERRRAVRGRPRHRHRRGADRGVR